MEKLNYKITDIAAADAFFDCISELSDMAKKYSLDLESAAALLNDALKKTSVRSPMGDYDVAILGTAEARMQTADVVILTGLNDGMFPGDGFRHSWLSKSAADIIGLPSSDSKVSLMALDFMTLSCGKKVYWTRSKMSGGTATVPSRFLSRVNVKAHINQGSEILAAIRKLDDVPLSPIDTAPPVAKYDGSYWATWLEDLIHNPYQFYAKHILHLRKNPDIGEDVGAREFGTFVHDVLENCARGGIKTEAEIIARLEDAALKYIERENVLFRFWQNRFREMAPVILGLMNNGVDAESEKEIEMTYFGRRLHARADRIENGSRVIDYKTGGIPTNAQLGLGKDADCTMPQLPVEAMMLGAPMPTMAFLRLQKNNSGLKEFDAEQTAASIDAVKRKLNFIFNQDTYARPDHFLDEKYTDFDDLCREV